MLGQWKNNLKSLFSYLFKINQQEWDLGGAQQCDQIGRYIALWATFRSLWQQLFCPNILVNFL